MALETLSTITTCPTCTHAKSNPFRSRNNQGIIVLGCIDAFHDDEWLSDSWHNRKEAVAWRKAIKSRMKKLLA